MYHAKQNKLGSERHTLHDSTIKDPKEGDQSSACQVGQERDVEELVLTRNL